MSTNWIIETKNLGRSFGGKWAVRGLNLQVPGGCVYGFLGLNGAGKSTTIRMLMGMLGPDEGSARVLGLDPSVDDIGVKRRVGYVPDLPLFYEWMTVAELLAFVAGYRKQQWNAMKVEELLQLFELDRGQVLKGLSKGQRTRVSLLLALAYGPELLILDEPTGGLDPVMRRSILEDLLAAYMDEGRTIFISSHLINEIAGLVDYVGIIGSGSLLRSQPVDELLAGLRRVRLGFGDDPPGAITCSGMISNKRRGREWVVTVDGFSEERTLGELKVYGAETVTVEGLSLEDAFVELVGEGRSGK